MLIQFKAGDLLLLEVDGPATLRPRLGEAVALEYRTLYPPTGWIVEAITWHWCIEPPVIVPEGQSPPPPRPVSPPRLVVQVSALPTYP